MKNNIQLLTQYKEEKTLIVGGPDERTGLEPFPTFNEWKKEYVAAYMLTHKEVSVEEADALFDAVVEEAEEELEKGILGLIEVDLTTDIEEDEDDETLTLTEQTNPLLKGNTNMTTATETKVKKTPAKPAVKKSPAKKVVAKKAAKPAVKKSPAKKPSVKKVKQKSVAKPVSKTAEARKLFLKMFAKKTRGEVIAKFVDTIGLKPNAASTYYQNFKKELEVI